jgi:uncharacterized protein (UPF0147 family)
MPPGIARRNGREDVEEAVGRQGDNARVRCADILSVAESQNQNKNENENRTRIRTWLYADL